MSARRSKRNTRISPRISPRRPSLLEGLEQRLMFTTVITDSDPLTFTPETISFEYKDARDNPVRVTVHGDVSAEFIFARITPGSEDTSTPGNDIILGEYVPASNEDEDGHDLFHVYIAQASIDSYISIAEFDAGGSEAMTPYTGNVTLRIQPLRDDSTTIATDEGTGNIYLGARTRDAEFPEADDDEDIPIRSDNFNGQGIAPASIANKNGRLVAGVRTAAGVSLGRFMFAGTVSGNVYIDGSMDTFYCGQLLTGVTEGDSRDTITAPDNFIVTGDLRNLLVKGSVGTEHLTDDDFRTSPRYLSGVDIQVGGKVGQIKAGGSYAGFGEIVNNLSGLGLRTRQQEIETRAPSLDRGDFTDFEDGLFGDSDAFFNNDTFETAQFLGSINSKQLGAGSAQVSGLYQWTRFTADTADFYGVALMAGQSVTVRLLAPEVFFFPTMINGQLVTEIPSKIHVGVYDPDNRLIASDYSNLGPESELNEFDVTTESDPAHFQPFTFVADRPGIYRFAVGKDPTFADPGLPLFSEQPYQLQISGIGNLALGALASNHNIVATNFGSFNYSTGRRTVDGPANIKTIYGDLGAITTPGFILSSGGSNGTAVGGDFRDMDARSLGFLSTVSGRFGSGPNIEVTTGSVGLIRSFGESAEDYTVFNVGNDNPIGGDYQLFDTENTTLVNLLANGSLGVLRAANMATIDLSSTIAVNVDGIGKPGIIDLIDIEGDLGTLDVGGPEISTNIGGNVRYMRIGGTAFRPRIFGGSLPEETTFARGQSAYITDDSGAQVVLTPTKEFQVDINGNPVFDFDGNPIDLSGTLTVLTYPIARSKASTGGGGSAILRVQSTRGVGVRTTGGSVEIGEIESTGFAPGLVPKTLDGITPDPGPDGFTNSGDEPFVLDPNSTAENSIDFKGARADVFSITGGSYNYIRNFTDGEIVSINTGTIGLLEANTLGTGRSSIRPGMVTEGRTVFDNGDTFPFVSGRSAIVINGGDTASPAVATIRARQFMGNVAISGIVQNAEANSDGIGVKGVFEGINGPFFVNGQIRRIMIGEGVLPSGTGDMSRAGIYVAGNPGGGAFQFSGRVWEIENQGPGSDIRGDVVAYGRIGKVNLNGGSIINSDFFVGHVEDGPINGSDLAFSREFASDVFDFEPDPNGHIEEINIVGGGGIIGGNFIGTNIGTINVAGGFGIINSRFLVQGNGRFGKVTAGGYGVRGVDWIGGQSVDSINATGDGSRYSTNNTPIGVRLSEALLVDPLFGTKPSVLTDIHIALGTSKADPRKKGATSSGALKNLDVRVSRDVGSVIGDSISSSVFNLGNNIGNFTSASYTERVVLTAGRIDNIHIGKDAIRTDFAISGPVGKVYIGGSFKGSSRLAAGGPNGSINRFIANNTLYGNVSAAQQINSIRVGTHYGSQGTHSGGNTLEFIVGGDLLTSSILDVNKTLSKLVVGGNFAEGATVKAGILGTTTIIGENLGDFVIG